MPILLKLLGDIYGFFATLLNAMLDTKLLTASPSPARKIAPWSGHPDVTDVLLVKHLLIRASNATLPPELVDAIVDAAHYWPRVSSRLRSPRRAYGNHDEDVLLLRSPPISSIAADTRRPGDFRSPLPPEPTLRRPVRQVVWTLRSHDQGWSGEARETHGTYRSSYTWFEADVHRCRFRTGAENDGPPRCPHAFMTAWLEHDSHHDTDEDLAAFQHNWSCPGRGRPYFERVQAPVWPKAEGLKPEYHVQHNVQSKKQATEHHIVWSAWDGLDSVDSEALQASGRGPATGDGTFVRCLEWGDFVTLRARAQYPAWVNYVDEAEVAIYFMV